jgi:hypothetical protein
MEQQTVRKTFKEKLRPTRAQERVLDDILWRCRALYNTALEQHGVRAAHHRLATPPGLHHPL